MAWTSVSNNLIVASGRHVRLHEVSVSGNAPSRRPRTFAVHKDDVVAVATLGPARALSASRDGTLHIWDTDDAVCLRTIDIGEPVLNIAVPRYDCEAWGGYVVVASTKNVLLVLVAPERSTDSKPRRVLFQNRVDRVHCDESGSTVIGISGNKIHVAKLSCRSRDSGSLDDCAHDLHSDGSPTSGAKDPVRLSSVGVRKRKDADVVLWRRTLNIHQEITAAAVSPEGTSVAVGDAEGCISVFQDVCSPSDTSAAKGASLSSIYPSKLHWHSSAVKSLCFSGGGNVLLSGGAEAVLVSWKVSQAEFGDRNFRPRLGGTIWGISPSPDERLVALTCADNSVRIVDAFNMMLRAELNGLSVPSEAISGSHRAAVLRKVRRMSITPAPGRDGCVLVTGVGGSVQVFDVYRGEHVGFFPIAPRNRVHVGGRGSTPTPRHPLVSHAQMSTDGESMATVDVQTTFKSAHDEGNELEILRFWQHNSETDSLDMVARLERPHGVHGSITAIEFHPTLPVVATSSSSGTIKIWRLVRTGVVSRPFTWRCETERVVRGLACTSLSFSADGSLLAVGTGSKVVLWQVICKETSDDPDLAPPGSVSEGSSSSVAIELLHTFVHPPSKETVMSVRFIPGDLPVVVSRTENGLYVWNVLAQSIWWSLRLFTSNHRIAVDAASKRFAIAVSVPRSIGRPTESNATRKKKKQLKPESKAEPGNEPSDEKSGADKCLLVFDAGSPVPLQVHRLPRGVRIRAMAFVSPPGHVGVHPLVYVDSNLELHVIADEESDVFSSVTDVHRSDEGEEPDGELTSHRLDDLLGTMWRSESEGQTRPTQRDSLSIGEHAVVSSLGRSFAGPTHTLAPVSTTALDSIVAMLTSAKLRPGKESAADQEVSDRDGGPSREVDDRPDGETSHAGHPIDHPSSLTSSAGRAARVARYLSACRNLDS